VGPACEGWKDADLPGGPSLGRGGCGIGGPEFFCPDEDLERPSPKSRREEGLRPKTIEKKARIGPLRSSAWKGTGIPAEGEKARSRSAPWARAPTSDASGLPARDVLD